MDIPLLATLQVISVPIDFNGEDTLTDAAAFAKAGIDATALIGLPTSLFAKEYIYHTMKDTVENIEPEAVEAVFNIAINYIIRSDNAMKG